MTTFEFQYLVRFEDQDRRIHYGNLTEESPADQLHGRVVAVLEGDPISGLKASGKKAMINKCIGVNYANHAQETNFKVPSQPIVFTKPADSIAGPFDEIYCHTDARAQLDYEGELCFIFSKDCRDVSETDALGYVLGYTIGNDLSARNYIPHEISGYQMSYGKSFDSFAPFGPYIVSPRTVGDPQNLRLVTKVNGQVRQNENTSDMIWNIQQIISHLSRGRTVRAGTVCMTGTPSGVGWFMKPAGFLQSGDTVDVSIEKLGSLVVTIVY
ncbi:hypothetical protein LTR84_010765 [Exophiala bonariae]|uniref:Fumarylacetoacetase-like C-terminal domain-containing protein n=1 Tax=Exophiala bonariae TaxID=1690606 RepID=A0AAV9MSP8_9EURO|nr:hypothetical protein LTR84_010765 [Exophiala bonariae]